MDGLTQDGMTGGTPGARGTAVWTQKETTSNVAYPRFGNGLGEHAANDARVAWLERTIEGEIIPRLMLAHASSQSEVGSVVEAKSVGSVEEVLEFAELVLRAEVIDVSAFVDRRRARGVPLVAIYLDLLAPTARHLGQLWEADKANFAEVTLGLWRLQQVLHDLGPEFRDEQDVSSHGRRALLIPTFGEQHTLGLNMVREFFRRAGWEVCGESPPTLGALEHMMHAEWFDLAGVSAGCEVRVEGMKEMIQKMRAASRNRAIAVLVGGPIFVAHPEYVEMVGADAMAHDARDAITRAEGLVALRQVRT
ncbi:MAG: cobalamin-dependent protein [Burkholderiaceae bacterium]|jgi:methanogenic corrinoid protein MtbC1